MGYGISIAFLIICFFWSDNNYFITGLITFYLISMIYGLYEKIQYAEVARPHLIYFSTVNDRLYDLPGFLNPLFYLAIFSFILYLDNEFFGPFGIHYLIGVAIVSIWSSFYEKIPTASLSLDKKDNEITCYDGVETYEVSIDEIQNINVSKKKISINTPSKKINLVHLSLDEKEMRLILDYFRSQLQINPIISEEEKTPAAL